MGRTIVQKGVKYAANLDLPYLRDIAVQVETLSNTVSTPAISGLGNLYYAEPTSDGAGLLVGGTTASIDRVNLSTLTTSRLLGTGAAGDVDGAAGTGQIGTVFQVALSGQTLWIADYGNGKLKRADLQSGLLTTVRALPQLCGVTVGDNGLLYLLQNTPTAQLSSYDILTGTLTPLTTLPTAGMGNIRYSRRRSAVYAASGDFQHPAAHQGLWRHHLLTGQAEVVAGSGTPGAENGPGPQATFAMPLGMSLGNLDRFSYLVDLQAHDVRRIDLDTGLVSTVAGNGTPANVDGVGTAAQFSGPVGLGLTKGTIYVTQNGRLRKIV
jgi:hypothetical protein